MSDNNNEKNGSKLSTNNESNNNTETTNLEKKAIEAAKRTLDSNDNGATFWNFLKSLFGLDDDKKELDDDKKKSNKIDPNNLEKLANGAIDSIFGEREGEDKKLSEEDQKKKEQLKTMVKDAKDNFDSNEQINNLEGEIKKLKESSNINLNNPDILAEHNIITNNIESFKDAAQILQKIISDNTILLDGAATEYRQAVEEQTKLEGKVSELEEKNQNANKIIQDIETLNNIKGNNQKIKEKIKENNKKIEENNKKIEVNKHSTDQPQFKNNHDGPIKNPEKIAEELETSLKNKEIGGVKLESDQNLESLSDEQLTKLQKHFEQKNQKNQNNLTKDEKLQQLYVNNLILNKEIQKENTELTANNNELGNIDEAIKQKTEEIFKVDPDYKKLDEKRKELEQKIEESAKFLNDSEVKLNILKTELENDSKKFRTDHRGLDTERIINNILSKNSNNLEEVFGIDENTSNEESSDIRAHLDLINLYNDDPKKIELKDLDSKLLKKLSEYKGTKDEIRGTYFSQYIKEVLLPAKIKEEDIRENIAVLEADQDNKKKELEEVEKQIKEKKEAIYLKDDEYRELVEKRKEIRKKILGSIPEKVRINKNIALTDEEKNEINEINEINKQIEARVEAINKDPKLIAKCIIGNELESKKNELESKRREAEEKGKKVIEKVNNHISISSKRTKQINELEKQAKNSHSGDDYIRKMAMSDAIKYGFSFEEAKNASQQIKTGRTWGDLSSTENQIMSIARKSINREQIKIKKCKKEMDAVKNKITLDKTGKGGLTSILDNMLEYADGKKGTQFLHFPSTRKGAADLLQVFGEKLITEGNDDPKKMLEIINNFKNEEPYKSAGRPTKSLFNSALERGGTNLKTELESYLKSEIVIKQCEDISKRQFENIKPIVEKKMRKKQINNMRNVIEEKEKGRRFSDIIGDTREELIENLKQRNNKIKEDREILVALEEKYLESRHKIKQQVIGHQSRIPTSTMMEIGTRVVSERSSMKRREFKVDNEVDEKGNSIVVVKAKRNKIQEFITGRKLPSQQSNSQSDLKTKREAKSANSMTL